MIHYDKIDVSEGIDINKAGASKEWDVCHNWFFLNLNLKFPPSVCSRCHGLSMMSVNLSDNAIWNTKRSGFCCIISLISKNEAINLLQNASLTEKSGIL